MLTGLAVSAPSSCYTQEELIDLLGVRGNGFAEKIFARCGVEQQVETSFRVLAQRGQRGHAGELLRARRGAEEQARSG